VPQNLRFNPKQFGQVHVHTTTCRAGNGSIDRDRLLLEVTRPRRLPQAQAHTQVGANLIAVAPGEHGRHRQSFPKNHLLSGAAAGVVESRQRPFARTPAFLEQQQSDEEGRRPIGEFDANRDIATLGQRPSERRSHVADMQSVSRKIMFTKQRLDDLVVFKKFGIQDRMPPGCRLRT
jgi:hypothetical protein